MQPLANDGLWLATCCRWHRSRDLGVETVRPSPAKCAVLHGGPHLHHTSILGAVDDAATRGTCLILRHRSAHASNTFGGNLDSTRATPRIERRRARSRAALCPLQAAGQRILARSASAWPQVSTARAALPQLGKLCRDEGSRSQDSSGSLPPMRAIER